MPHKLAETCPIVSCLLNLSHKMRRITDARQPSGFDPFALQVTGVDREVVAVERPLELALLDEEVRQFLGEGLHGAAYQRLGLLVRGGGEREHAENVLRRGQVHAGGPGDRLHVWPRVRAVGRVPRSSIPSDPGYGHGHPIRWRWPHFLHVTL